MEGEGERKEIVLLGDSVLVASIKVASLPGLLHL